MAFGFSKTKYSPIAIDFGADSLKLLQVVPGDPPQIVAAACAEVPENARTDPAARHAFYSEALRLALRHQPFKGNRAVCSVPAYQTLVQHFQIAKVEHEDLEEQVGVQLRQRFNVEPGRMVVRTVQVGQIVRDGSPKQEVICMAASKDAVMRHLETAHRMKLDVVGMHCEPHAIVKSFAYIFRRHGDEQRTNCYIDIGGATTKVVITHGTQMVFAQTIHAGGDQLTRVMARQENLNFSEARKRRIAAAANLRPPTEAARTPAPAAEGDRRGKGGGPSGLSALDAAIAAEFGEHTGGVATVACLSRASAKAAPALDPMADTLDCLIDELRLCIRYHGSMFADRPVEKLVFLGGEARNLATCQQIAKALRIGAQLGDPLARASKDVDRIGYGVDLRDPQPGWAVPLGLCLSETAV